MAKVVALVSFTERSGREELDSEIEVGNLKELFRVCRDARPSQLMRVSLLGAEGEVRLNFASFIPRR